MESEIFSPYILSYVSQTENVFQIKLSDHNEVCFVQYVC
jgi:hypothetical protein